MKTIKMSLANMEGKLSRKEMKNVLGGLTQNTCAVNCPMPDGGVRTGLSMDTALNLFNQCKDLGYAANWCCDSCGSATWL